MKIQLNCNKFISGFEKYIGKVNLNANEKFLVTNN